ncbi:MAG TPA: CDP-alcohol phosphatidyltransferase family protein [Kofleriaceae bacterium]|nr:CDP-alcohol phosphatidyltransferase family protein [Kofleriaceae bacterium]
MNPANAVSVSRLLALPPFLWAVAHGWQDVAMLAALACGLLDKLDGLVAKIFKCQSEFGGILDAVMDAICYGFFLVVLIYFGWVPAIPAIGVIALGVINTAVRAGYARRLGRATNYKSYAMERVVAFAAYLSGFGTLQYEVDFFFWTCMAVMAVVVVHDAKRMLIDPVPA